MSNRKTARKLAAAVLGGALLAGLGTGAAMADIPAAAAGSATAQAQDQPPPCGGQPLCAGYWYRLYNNTPYTLTLDPANTVDQWWDGTRWVKASWFYGAPPQQLQPGEVMVMNKSGRSTYHPDGNDQWVSFTFADTEGRRHMVQVHTDRWDALTSFSKDCDAVGKNCTESTATFHMELQPGAPNNSVGAFLNKPAEITIDAKTNPDGAANVMKLFPDATNRTYTIIGDPFWSESEPVQGSARLINATSAQASLTAETGTINSHTVSTSTEVSWETSLELAHVAKLSVENSLTGGQDWGTEDEVTNGATIVVEPGQVGWFDKVTQNQSVTGDFNFSAYKGAANYHVKNVTVSAKGLTKPGHNGIPVPGTGFTACTEPAGKN